LREAIEFNRQDAIASAGTEYTEEKIAVPAWKEPSIWNTSGNKVVNSSEKAPVTPGGGIRVKTNALLYHGTQKLTMTLQEKYAKTLE
jgi:hypothetical protein